MKYVWPNGGWWLIIVNFVLPVHEVYDRDGAWSKLPLSLLQ
jgi:hypothetical protein